MLFRERLLARLAAAGLQSGPAVPNTSLDQAQLTRLEQYFELLRRWNRRINLTSLPLEDATDAAIDRLLVEPLCAGPLFRAGSVNWADLGSGGGSPAIPLKILRPASRLTMVESRSRKAAFLRTAASELELDDVRVLGSRVEEIDPTSIEAFDLLTPGGQLLLFLPSTPATAIEGFISVGELRAPNANSAVVLMGRANVTGSDVL